MAIPSWNEWLRTHPWAKTPQQRKVLRTNYDKMVAGAPGATPPAAAAPRYTPGGLGPNAIAGINNRQLRYTQLTGKDALGRPTGGVGSIEQKRLLRMADVGAGRATAERQRSEGIQTVDRNAAARGLGKSGIRDVNRGKVTAQHLEVMGGLQRAEDQAAYDARQELDAEDYAYQQDVLGMRQAGSDEDYANWLAANPSQGDIATTADSYAGVPKTAITTDLSPLPTWDKWLQTHPWAKTPEQKRVLRRQYDQMAARRR